MIDLLVATAFILVGMMFAWAAYSIRPRSHVALCLGTGFAWVWLGGTWLP